MKTINFSAYHFATPKVNVFVRNKINKNIFIMHQSIITVFSSIRIAKLTFEMNLCGRQQFTAEKRALWPRLRGAILRMNSVCGVYVRNYRYARSKSHNFSPHSLHRPQVASIIERL
jgi:hypothetical protein